jgi:ketosteroid isomerase-like protein
MDVRELIDSYNDAWNRQDLDAIHAAHADDIVFHNHTADERVEGADAVRAHIARIFENWPTLRFMGRSLRVADDFAVSEWTARGEKDGRLLEWDGVDIFPIVDGKLARKDVYSTSFSPRIASGTSPTD